MQQMNSTYIPAAHYVSKTEAAKYLKISIGKLQYHIGKGRIKTLPFPNLGHLINEWDVMEFEKILDGIKPGKPSIYKKYCERCDKLGFDKCLCKVK